MGSEDVLEVLDPLLRRHGSLRKDLTVKPWDQIAKVGNLRLILLWSGAIPTLMVSKDLVVAKRYVAFFLPRLTMDTVFIKKGLAKMLGDKIGSMTLQETSKPIDSGKYGLPAMDTNTVGGGSVLGHEVKTQAAFTAHMRPDGSWAGHAYAGVLMCAEGVATYKCDGIGNMTESGGVSFRGGAIFETTSEALSELNGKYYMFTYEADAEGAAVWELYPCK